MNDEKKKHKPEDEEVDEAEGPITIQSDGETSGGGVPPQNPPPENPPPGETSGGGGQG